VDLLVRVLARSLVGELRGRQAPAAACHPVQSQDQNVDHGFLLGSVGRFFGNPISATNTTVGGTRKSGPVLT
jgi:hypothetical protein